MSIYLSSELSRFKVKIIPFLGWAAIQQVKHQWFKETLGFVKTFDESKQDQRFLSERKLRPSTVFEQKPRARRNELEDPGIDPGTSRMLSERSTMWASPPDVFIGNSFNFL